MEKTIHLFGKELLMTSRPASRNVLSTVFTLAVFLSAGSFLYALPPLGLTQISPSATVSKLDIIDGTAYVASDTGLWKVDTSGIENLGSYSVPVKATDGNLYALGGQGMLYRLDPSGPTFFHQYVYYPFGPEPEILDFVTAIDSELRAYGQYGDATRFNFDGTDERLSGGVSTFIAVTPKGWALGEGEIVGTIASGTILWQPHGPGQTYPLDNGWPGTIRDRYTGTGVNMSDDMDVSVLLGDTVYAINKPDGSFFSDFDDNVVVSHSNFTVINDFNIIPAGPTEFYAFYPGINPDFPNRAVPLLDIFPQLAAIDIDSISSAASVDGYLYLTINSSDGLYLFGAPDPSLVPEPTAFVLLLALAMPHALRRV